MNQCSKFGQKTSQFPCHGSSQGDLGEDFPALFFLCYSLFFLSCIFSCTQLQKSKYILLILYTLFSPRKAGITRIQIVLQNNKINLALRIAVLSVNGTIQNGIGDIRQMCSTGISDINMLDHLWVSTLIICILEMPI